MKRFLLIFLTFCLTFAFCSFSVGCNLSNPSCQHTYSNDCDASCNLCGNQRQTEHVYDNACDNFCNVCNDERQTEHTYDNACDKVCNVCNDERQTQHVYDNNCDNFCNVCNDERQTEHVYDNACDKVCNVCNDERQTEHVYDNACDKVCNVCNDERLTEHVYDNACDKICNVCNDERQTEHTYDNACDKVCNVCNDERQTEHIYDNACDKVCNVCNDERLTEHIYDNACDKVCNVCNDERLTEHVYDNDCDNFCNVCNDERQTEHAYSRWNLTKAPTDSAEGAQEHYCTNCGYYENQVLSILTPTPVEYFDFESYSVSNATYYKITGYNGNFESVVVPRSHNNKTIKIICTDAFKGHSEIINMYIPDTILTIEECALNGCSGLRSLTVPFIGSNLARTSSQQNQYPLGYIFGWQYNSQTIWTDMTTVHQQYHGSSTKNTTSASFAIPKNLETLAVTGGNLLHGALMSCDMIKTLILPESCTKIEPYAFNSMQNLEYVTFPKNLTTIGEYAFTYNYRLKKLVFPNTLNYIGEKAFYDCSLGFNVVVIPKSVKTIGKMAFNGLLNGTRYIYYESETPQKGWATDWGYMCSKSSAFVKGADGLQYQISKDGTYYLVSGYTGSEQLVRIADVHNGLLVLGIADNAFLNNTTVTQIVINRKVAMIGDNAFTGCDNLTAIYYDGTITAWNNLELGLGIEDKLGLVHYLYSDQVTGEYKYWEMINGIPTVKEIN